MPGLDGLSMLRALRGDPATQDLPVLLLTAERDVETEAQGLEYGADDYILKPVEPRRLAARAKAAIARARRRIGAH
jgi:DNA-binding response OmpR family regulator